VLQQAVRAAVAFLGGHQQLARVQQLQDEVERRHAGGRDDRARPALDLGKGRAEGAARRVAAAAVVVLPLLAEAGEGVVGRKVQRCDDRPVLRIGFKRRAKRGSSKSL